MSQRHLTYNPALLTDAELVDTFVVRQVDLQLIVETIRDNDGPSNQHVVVVGGRGMGKTTLVSRVALAVNQDPELSRRWTPVLFGEESYDVGSIGALWLKALERLAETVDEPRWREAFEAVRKEQDETRLGERAVGRLLDYARDNQKRILLVVENFDMLLTEQLEQHDAWALRHTLQQHPEIMLLATAIDYESVFGRERLPLYGFAREHRLQPLSLAETRELWVAVANKERRERETIPIHRLTGGTPRLVAIVASFAAQRSFRELMDELVTLVDEHTSYFKATMEALPAVERRVYSTLADIWAPATSRQVAERSRMSTNKASALLARLVDRKLVKEVGKGGRAKRYELVERLYNIYHLMRSRGGEQRAQMKALVEFMSMFYESDDLADIMGGIAREATSRPDEQWIDYLEVYRLLSVKLSDHSRLASVTPPSFLVRMLRWQHVDAEDLLPVELMAAMVEFNRSPDKDSAMRVASMFGAVLGVDAMEALRRLLADPQPGVSSRWLGQLDGQVIRSIVVRLLPWLDGPSASIEVLEELRRATPLDWDVLMALIVYLHRAGRYADALVHTKTLTGGFPRSSVAWLLHGWILESQEDYEGVTRAYRKSLVEFDHPTGRFLLAAVLCRNPDRREEARALSRTVAFEDGYPRAWLKIAEAEDDSGRALEIARKLFTSDDSSIAVAAFSIVGRVISTFEDGAASLEIIVRETLETHPESPGSLIANVCLTLLAVASEDETSWSLLEAVLGHPRMRANDIECLATASFAILALARLDRARVLTMLEALDVGTATSPVIVALRVMLGGDVSTLPAEIVAVGRDLAATMATTPILTEVVNITSADRVR